MPSATDVNLGHGVISPFTVVKAKIFFFENSNFFEDQIFLEILIFFSENLNFEKLSNAERSIKLCKNIKKGFQLPKVKSPQEENEKKEMKYTLAFHAEGKKQLIVFRLVDGVDGS